MNKLLDAIDAGIKINEGDYIGALEGLMESLEAGLPAFSKHKDGPLDDTSFIASSVFALGSCSN